MADKNSENIEALKKIIGRKEQIAIFVGAGSSEPLGIQTWDNILIGLGKTAGYTEDKIKEFIEKYNRPNTASIIYKKFDDKNTYNNCLKELFTPSKIPHSALHLTALRFKTIFSTNFDNAFEKACEWLKKEYNVQKFPYFNPFKVFTNNEKINLIYLHGNNDEQKYIFREEDYNSYYPSISLSKGNTSDELESFLKYILKFINLIFIGFSFDDMYIVKFFKKVLSDIKNEKEIHRNRFKKEHPIKETKQFAIIFEDSEKINELEEMGINVITYGTIGPIYKEKDHAKIIEILDNILPSDMEVKNNVGKEASRL